jgi:drug/metabolite transporter (DMT)-like permease
MPDKLRTALVLCVSLVWGVNFCAPVFIKSYVPPPEVNVLFMAIVGALMLPIKKDTDDSDHEDEDD